MRPKYSDKNALRFWMDGNDALMITNDCIRGKRRFKIFRRSSLKNHVRLLKQKSYTLCEVNSKLQWRNSNGNIRYK